MTTTARAMTFTAEDRGRFHAAVRTAALDESVAAATAETLARRWLSLLPSPPGIELPSILVHKVAGYNADLHQVVRRALRARAAAARWLTDHGIGAGDTLEFPHGDLRLGEYFLLQHFTSTRGRVRSSTPWSALLALLARAHPPRSRTPGFRRHEVELLTAGRADATAVGRFDVAFIATMDNYLNPMLAVIAELVGRGVHTAVILPRESSAWANAARIDARATIIHLEDLVTPDLAERHSAWRSAAANDWASRAPTLAPVLQVAGIDLWPLVHVDLEHVATDCVPAARSCAEIGERLVHEHGVKVVVCARLRRLTEIAVCSAARRAGARAVMLVHGHVSRVPERVFEDGSFDGVDAVCAWGTDQRQAILEKATVAKPGPIVPTGNPAWDSLRPPDEADRRSIRARIAVELDLNPGLRWVMVTTQQDSRTQFAEVAAAVLANPDAALIVKTHPRESQDLYESCLGMPGGDRARIIAGVRPPLHDLLSAADALLTFHSTTNIESLLLGTPVITAALGELRNIDRLVSLERFGLPLAHTAAQLRELLAAVCADPSGFRRSLQPAINAARHAIAGVTGTSAQATARVCEIVLGRPTVA
ncbi:MAG: hypothetical protein L6Q35_05325 [Phycisphaerales bacterium]|nr:hypothetical protein [Phycisphaerales bacterium]